MIDPHSDRAAYRQVADLLRAGITSGAHPPGALLPSERRLMQEQDLSRQTVRDAISVLVGEGLVVRLHGEGTRVVDYGEREQVRVPRGADMVSRMPTAAERVELDIEPGLVTPIVLVTIGGKTRKYAAHRTRFTFS